MNFLLKRSEEHWFFRQRLKSMNMKKYFWISYFVILFLIAGLLGYMIALCPCNTSIGTGMLYCLMGYIFFAINVVFHLHKIAQIKVGYAILLSLGFGTIGGIVVWFLENVLPNEIIKIITPNYFMEWFISCFSAGLIIALGILLANNVKKKLILTKNKPY